MQKNHIIGINRSYSGVEWKKNLLMCNHYAANHLSGENYINNKSEECASALELSEH